MAKLTKHQSELLNLITQELRRETALAYIASGYDNKTKAYLAACKKMKRDPSKNPETSASEILSYPNVLGFINSVKIEIAQEAKIDAAWVLMSAKKVYDRCMQEEAVTDKEGDPTGEYKFEHSGANAALGIIGKHIDVQAFLDKKEVAVVEMTHEEWLDNLK
jgi:phage terminase small subunit